MPRFHFDIHDGVAQPDPDGLEMRDKDEAWAEAVRSCGEMLKDIDGQLQPGSEWRMDVTDAARKPVFTLCFIATEHAASAASESGS